MTATSKGSHAPLRVQLNFQAIRNLTSPDEKSNGIQTLFANLPMQEIVKLNTEENLRGYIAEYNGRRRNGVHVAIRDTIEKDSEKFIVRNSGFTITADAITIDENKKVLFLDNPSIINGAQSQGEIRQYLIDIADPETGKIEEYPEFHVRAEIIIDPDPKSVVETAIARNTQTPVKAISQAAARGHLDELEKSIQHVFPDAQIRRTETEEGEDLLETERLLQWARLLMPESVSKNSAAAEKLRAYKNRKQCLTDFSEWYSKRKTDPEAQAKYEFTVEIAPHALAEYNYWERHNGWNGHRLWEETKKGGRAVRRDAQSRVSWVAPGILYPIMGAMSEFVVQDSKSGSWTIKKPTLFKSEEMISRTVSQFRAHDSDPMYMGRSAAAYDALRIYPATLMEVLRDAKSAG